MNYLATTTQQILLGISNFTFIFFILDLTFLLVILFFHYFDKDEKTADENINITFEKELPNTGITRKKNVF